MNEYLDGSISNIIFFPYALSFSDIEAFFHLQKYYIFIDYNGDVLGVPTKWDDVVELSAAQETSPINTFGIRTGTKKELIDRYNLDEEDFFNE